MDLQRLTIAEIHDGLRARQWSCQELAQASLDRIAAADKTLGAFLRTRPHVLEEAAAADQRLADGHQPRALEGVPIAVKDNILVENEVTTAAARILENYTAVYSATVVERLQAAGALIVGKTNLDEFAMGTSTENSALGVTRNPWDTKRVPGGSSGGSVVSVAAGHVTAALGSDTGGSIRQPASFCNTVGFKPTYGRVSRYGLMALASSLDQIGPITRTVPDAAAVYQAMAGWDDHDATTSRHPIGELPMTESMQGLHVGLPEEFFGEGVDPKVAATIREAAEVFRQQGAKVTSVSLPHARYGLPTYYIIQPAEASSNLARYDGIRYGLSQRDGRNLLDIYQHTRRQGFGPETQRRILIGTFVLSAGYVDAYYHQANRVRAAITEEFHRLFDQVDILLAPTAPTTAFELGAKIQDPLTMYLADLLTVPANLAGIPAISLPGGFVDDLPVGLQLMAKQWDEAALFRAAAAYQRVTDWHERLAPISA